MSGTKTRSGLNLKLMRYVAPHAEEAADAGEGSVDKPCTQDLPGCIFSGRGKVTTFGPSKGHLGDQPYHHTTPWEQSGRALRGTGGLYHRGAEVRDSEGHRCEEVAERRSVGFGDAYEYDINTNNASPSRIVPFLDRSWRGSPVLYA